MANIIQGIPVDSINDIFSHVLTHISSNATLLTTKMAEKLLDSQNEICRYLTEIFPHIPQIRLYDHVDLGSG